MRFKIAIIILAILLIVTFVLQNTEIVIVKLWFWEVQTPRALLILLCLAVGIIIGFFVPSLKKKENTTDIKPFEDSSSNIVNQ